MTIQYKRLEKSKLIIDPIQSIAFIVVSVLLLVVTGMSSSAWSSLLPDNDEKTRDPQVQSLLNSLTLRQKIGQMVQVDITVFLDGDTGTIDPAKLLKLSTEYPIGSILNSPYSGQVMCPNASRWSELITQVQDAFTVNGPRLPVIYGLDSVHGASYVRGATLFPQQINIGASFNRSVSREVGHITAKDTRAIGVHWNFSPIADIALQPIWARVYETFGEDPYLAGEMVAEIIKGMQGYPRQLATVDRVAATMKHFIGYSISRTGYDRNPTWIPERVLYDYFVPPFQAAVNADVATAMESYQELNGVPTCSSERYLKTLLRDEMKFNGTLVTDWAEINELWNFHHVAKDVKDAVRQAMQKTTIDMSMVPLKYEQFFDVMTELVENDYVSMSRIDESVRRVLDLKKELGLLGSDRSVIFPNQRQINEIGSWRDRQVSLGGALESITLLKNDGGILPIRSNVKKILLVGPTGDCLRCLCGGWTFRHQGAENDSDFPFGSTILSALRQEALIRNIEVIFKQGTDLAGNTIDTDGSLRQAADDADLIILALGEGPYAETPGDIADLRLPPGQLDLVTKMSSIVPKDKMVMLLVEGRPRNLENTHELVDGIVLSWLPGAEGGEAIVSILFNNVAPSGRLPISYPKSLSVGLVPHFRKVTEFYAPLFPFGHGLSYTTFKYSDLMLPSKFNIATEGETIQISFTVMNIGIVKSKHSVLLYLSQKYRTVVPEAQKLVRFDKIELEPLKSRVVSFTLTKADFEFYGGEDNNIHRTIETGEWTVSVGDLKSMFETVS